MKKTVLIMIVFFASTIPAFAGVKDKALAPVNATASYVNKLANGTNETLTSLVGGANKAASGFFKDTNDFGKDTYKALTGQDVK